MRIGIDARFYGGEQSKGLGRYTQMLIEYLASTDDQNEYVIFLQEEGFENWHIQSERFTPVLAPYKWYTFSEQLFMPLLIWKQQVDFMHFPHFNVPLLYRSHFIATIHDLIIIHFPTERATTLGPLLYKIKHFAGQMVMRHAVKKAKHIITVSEFSKNDIAQYYGIEKNRISVTYEAAELEKDSSFEDVDLKKRYNIEKPYLLYIGNAYPHKNLEVVLDVIKEMSQARAKLPFQMVFVGKEDYFYARLKQKAWAMNIEKYIRFTGFVPDSHLPALYANAVAYIFPSKYEGFGLPPLEAMSAGTPVLAASSSCLPEVLGDAAFYFDPEDISGIIQLVEQVLSSPEYREKMSLSGKIQAERYSWEKMAKQTLEVYLLHGKQQEKSEKKH